MRPVFFLGLPCDMPHKKETRTVIQLFAPKKIIKNKK